MSRHFDQWTISRCRLYRVSTIRNGHGHDAILGGDGGGVLQMRMQILKFHLLKHEIDIALKGYQDDYNHDSQKVKGNQQENPAFCPQRFNDKSNQSTLPSMRSVLFIPNP